MTNLITRFLPSMVLTAGIALPGCVPVTGNRILGRDLALGLPASLTVGFAPAPGTKRIYTAMELERLARANGLSVSNPAEICFELPMVRLTEEDATAAMRRSLPPDAALKIIELANFDVPAGRLEFPGEGLEPPSAANHGVQLWRGHIKYAETRQASFWARVEVSVQFIAVVAATDLPANTPISAASVRLETRTGPIQREKLATRMEDLQGRMLKRALPAGSVIPVAALAVAPTVRRGDLVTVEVQSGPAHLQFEAIAESAAHDGDIVELRNPSNGKTFKARLDAGPKALVVIPAGQKL
jgi:flagella basal body P-ring formation protein FlgA